MAAVALTVGFAGVAHADNIQDSIQTNTTSVTLVAGSGLTGTASIRVVGNSSDKDPDPNCNFDSSSERLTLNVVTPPGVTADPNPLTITDCGTDYPVTFQAAAGAQGGHATVTISTNTTGGTFTNQVDIPISVTAPANTKPSVAVTGVTDGSSYEINHVPTAGCAVTDAEDSNSTTDPVISGTLVHGLGTQTVTCDYTDNGGLAADTVSATYTIVDTGKPTITHSLSAEPNDNGWYKDDVTVAFNCDDQDGSGIDTCYADGETTSSKTIGEGADQSVTGTATDYAGNTATDTVGGLSVDETAPVVSLVGGPSGDYYYGNDPAAPTCDATDDLSGVAECVVSGGGSSVGSHTWTATATDQAGNTNTATIAYTVKPWELSGFYAPVDMGGTWNSVKGGSTVPLKFRIFNGATQLTDTADVKSLTSKAVACPGSTAPVDDIETVATGSTALRYDTTGGQFIQNWQTPKKPGTCSAVTLTTQDGGTITANFLFK